MTEREFGEKIACGGGRAYIVGGWVRDMLRGIAPKDKDYVVTGLDEASFYDLFPEAVKIGRAFPVYLLKIDGKSAEVAFARRECKTGGGYRGFAVSCAPSIGIEADLYRRDTTMNSIARPLDGGALIDPYGGGADIARGVIRATSHHFVEDPVRSLRAARQAAETGFSITPDTIALMRACRAELAGEPKERLFLELTKALRGAAPAAFFGALREAALLEIAFPQVYALIGQTQPPEYHPEGDAFAHTMLVLDRVAALTDRVEVRFAALAHDLGKGLTKPEELPHHYGHEANGILALRAFHTTMTLPKLWLVCAEFAIREHMRAARLRKAGKIVDFLLRLRKNPLGIDGFNAIIWADCGVLPPLLADGERSLAAIARVNGNAAPHDITGKAVGEWLRQRQILAYQNR